MMCHRSAFSAAIVAVALTACGGATQPTQAQLEPTYSAAGPMPQVRAWSRVRPSWISPAAKDIRKLLYVAGAVTNTVYVYDYKTHDLVGELTGFDQPSGECVDSKGDIWITSYASTAVTEYAHGGKTPLTTLTAAQTLQTSCSIDPATGNLAVGMFNGVLQVWKNGRGTPKIYTSSECPEFWSPGYDDKGNLFMEAAGNGTAVWVCELPHGGSSLQHIPINWTISYGSGTMWDGKYMAFADQSFEGRGLQSGVYQAKLDLLGSLRLVGETAFPDPCGNSDVLAPFIVGRKNTPDNAQQGTVAIGSNNSCLTNVDFWKYPAGGDPTYVLKAPDNVTYGTAVSIKE
jgi:hypothetical protein